MLGNPPTLLVIWEMKKERDRQSFYTRHMANDNKFFSATILFSFVFLFSYSFFLVVMYYVLIYHRVSPLHEF